MKHLSEQNYRARKAQLTGHLKTAEEAHGEVALQFELGEADQSAVDASRSSIAALKDSLEALEAAFRRSQSAEAQAEREATVARRRRAVATAEECMAERMAAVKAIEKLGAALDVETARLKAANRLLRLTALPAIREIERGFDADNLIPFESRDQEIIGQKIKTTFDTMNDPIPISDAIESANQNIRYRLEMLEVDDDDELEAA